MRGIDPTAMSPFWMTEQLRRSGLRSISSDCRYYKLCNVGARSTAACIRSFKTYLAAFDRALLRPARKLTLLDEKEIELDEKTIVITDDSGPIGLAGIMGGLSTAVTDTTTDVFFEAAFWPPDFMAGRARSYGMHTDASLRFERGVDPTGQARAVERATQLLVRNSRWQSGFPSLDQKLSKSTCRKTKQFGCARVTFHDYLGVEISADEVEQILDAPGYASYSGRQWLGWKLAPAHRFDISIEADLVEEVARIHGYDSIPVATAFAQTKLANRYRIQSRYRTRRGNADCARLSGNHSV